MTPRSLSVVVAALGAVLGIARTAPAQFLPLDVAELVSASEVVVVASVEEASSRWSDKLIVTDYRLRVEERIAGQVPERISLTQPGGTVGDETHRVSLAVPLDVGARYLLFLDDAAGRVTAATEITGGRQGAVREAPEAPGFDDLVHDVRSFVDGDAPDLAALAAKLAARREPPPKAAGEVDEPAVPPIVFNPLPDSSPFAPYDRELMAYWNVYQPDLFRTQSPTGTWSFGYDVFDMAGFADDAQLQAKLGRTWPNGGSSMTVSRSVNGRAVEADIVLNPAFTWTLDQGEATSPGLVLSFRHVVLMNLAWAWGYHTSLSIEEPRLESAIGIVPQFYRLATLFAEDTEAVRATFGEASLLDGLVSAYGVQAAPVYPLFVASRPVPSSVRRGAGFALPTPIKIETVGTEDLVDPTVAVYLVPHRFSMDGAVLLKRFRVRARVPRATLRHVVLPGTLKVPKKTAPGVYFLAFRLELPGDAHPGNDVAWSPYFVTLTVRAR